MLSKNNIKYLKSLNNNKYRVKENKFLAEGSKLVLDLIARNYLPEQIICTQRWLDSNPLNNLMIEIEDMKVIKQISSLKNPQEVIAVFSIPTNSIEIDKIKNQLNIVLDQIQDPGNLGTIIRTAEWFGIKDIFCIKGTVDLYNPKVIQSTMGAIANVNCHYISYDDFNNLVDQCSIPVYGTFMEGESIYNKELSSNAFIVMGNEGQGISNEIKELKLQKVTIPSFSNDDTNSESLNVAIATSIICAEFRRQNI